ncbi:MAG: chloride channel protein [Flammeovirgaceae bacterium]|nr:chloride channel protein [Flammeovirgaceae bacterium]MBE60747.1 chloride channel protein [Flammeovirgaceae bacterium]|tara:strand:+ start:2938 stop:4695 length:1758 start_codon:yes stop_codon:yes gene_type:complete
MRFLVWRLKHISDNNFLLIVASVIGLTAGLAAVTLKTTVHYVQHLLQQNLDLTKINYLYIVYPAIGIILTILIRRLVLKDTPGHGITRILRAISKNSSRIRKRYMFSNMIKSAITVGFGGSVGLEAPIVVTGSAIGSNFGQFVHLDYKKRTLLIGCGAAGAISAIFNSPIAGVIFAIEVILTEVKISKFIPILIASVSGQLISIILLGEDVLFSFKIIDNFQASDTGYYILLGIISGLASLYFTRVNYLTENFIDSVNNAYARAALGGLALALIIFVFPPIYGEGYNSILFLLKGNHERFFSGSFFYSMADQELVIIGVLFMITLVKPFATALTIGSGGSGGVFAPSLFMGGVVGFLFSKVVNVMYPYGAISSSNFTLVGMCGVMSGVLHAPLTAIFLIAEITGGYMLFVPLMLVSAISFTTISYFEKYSIYTKQLIEKGDLIQYDRDKIVLSLIDLKKIIEKDLLSIHPDAPLKELVDLVKISKRNIFPVINEHGALEGIVTLDDIREIMFDREKQNDLIVKTIMQKPPAQVSPQEKMQSVMNKFELTQAWNLPVIDEGKYLGFVSKSRIFNAYRKKLIRQTKE